MSEKVVKKIVENLDRKILEKEVEKPPESLVIAGRIVSVYGVKGWVKVLSFTENPEDLLNYQPWWLKTPKSWQKVTIDSFRETAKGLQCHIAGIDDRDQAKAYCQRDIWVAQDGFPELPDQEYYWHQLQGLRVVSCFEGITAPLGQVVSLYETGANDVLVVKGDMTQGAVDNRERWIPYIDQVVKNVDLENAQITVDWDPAF